MGIHGYFVNMSKNKFVFIGKLRGAPHPKYSHVLSALIGSEWKNDKVALVIDTNDSKLYDEISSAHYSQKCVNEYTESIMIVAAVKNSILKKFQDMKTIGSD